MPEFVPRTVRLKLGVVPKFPKELEELLKRLSPLVDSPELLQRILRAAAAETLLAAYRKRFLNNFAGALDMQRAGKKRKDPDLGRSVKRAQKTLNTLAEEINQAHLSGEPTGDLEKKMRKAEEALVEAYDKHFGGSDLDTGMFRPLAMQVLGLLTTLNNVGQDVSDSAVKLGIGHLPTLDAIKTPSATPMLTGKQTKSRMNVLWRHLEFGTGVYASKGTKNKWWYGPRRGAGIHLKGSKGVNALYDGRGVPYEADALRFESVFANMLTRALRG
jgi:hypothetical protein